jgi:hypothetical protein
VLIRITLLSFQLATHTLLFASTANPRGNPPTLIGGSTHA